MPYKSLLVSTGLAVLLVCGSAMAASGPIETGADLHLACNASLQMTAGQDGTPAVRAERHRCRNFLSGFVQASAATRFGNDMSGSFSPTGEDYLCYQLPQEMSWGEMEQLVVAHGDANPDALTMYAADFLVEVFATNYPCEEE